MLVDRPSGRHRVASWPNSIRRSVRDRSLLLVRSRPEPWAWLVRSAGLAALTLAGFFVIAFLLLWYGPDLIARHDIAAIAEPQRATHLQQARETVRANLLTFGAGLFAAGALVYTARNFDLSRRTLEISRRTFELAEQGQVTDRYTKAIGQLGSETLDIRIGGIYGLERVAHDSSRDHPPVMEVLGAFIREHSHEQWPLPITGVAAADRVVRPDVQAAMTVIGRRNTVYDREPIDLTAAILPKVTLEYANLASVDLTSADLRSAFLPSVDLAGADLTAADLTDASLAGANLVGADLTDADLTDADLTAADLTDADLTRANLRNAHLSEANLIGAFLSDAILTDAELSAARLNDTNQSDSVLNREEIPQGWLIDPASGRLRRSPMRDE